MQTDAPLRLDLEGLFCPEVVLRVKREIDVLASGSRIEIRSTDPLSEIDIPLFALKAGHEVSRLPSEAAVLRFMLMVGAGCRGGEGKVR